MVGVAEVRIDGDPGALLVMYGSAAGVSPAGHQYVVLDSGLTSGVFPTPPWSGELACGDFDGDLFSDLAIGAPGSNNGAGSVTIMYGSASGLTTLGDLWSQDSRGVRGVAAADEEFGAALSAADFDGDGFFDLAIGAPGDTVEGTRIGSVEPHGRPVPG